MNGTVPVKNFRLSDRLADTRLFTRHPNCVWVGYTSEWNAPQANAMLVRDGKQVTVGEQACRQAHVLMLERWPSPP